MRGICPFCIREVEFQHSIELSVFRYHLRKVYGVMVWDYCPECTRAISYAKYDMKRDKTRPIGYKAYKSEKVYGGHTMIDFGTLIERIKADRQGTLIVICGREGCGKTTLALKLMSSINGSEDISYIVTQSDLMRLESRRGVADARAHITDDLLDSKSAERVCELAAIGYIPIVTVPDLCYIPRQYRGPSKEGLSSVLVIQFGGQRGVYKAIYSMIGDDHELKTLKTSGKVTQEDVDMVQRMTEKMRDIRWSVWT